MKEHDPIILTRSLPDHEPPLFRTDCGTIVHVHNNGEAFEVELRQELVKKCVVTLKADMIEPYISLTEVMKKDLGLTDKDFSHHCSDLYVQRTPAIAEWLKNNYRYNCNVRGFSSNVKGQSWYGKICLDIPFAFEEYFEKRKLIHGK